MHLIRLVNSNEQFHCAAEKNILQGMQSLLRKGIPVGCRNGGCGICRIKIQHGSYDCKRMSREHVSEQEQAEGIALACRLYPKSDLDIEVLGLKTSRKRLPE
ncbi:2Fe-2S iron-sulfur cluster-binding protein [Acinetobacter baumannii]|uniref:2Fe-2S iron-sulfur cluster-binding protein n=1 Tax=Acinetobacter baumannii TaxID=470 RepID=UPI0011276C86|nr:2Fe-2S iron-sulfur cluster-binding protein [Acinetobacter baumannii]MCT9253875.1 2Fe-2S iron-sulfur cluster binding domain-containing protein [Acinetobacter baumannii]TPU92129.1 2Fe-2S iron-sulfur cluster binding domain-containing protein [Acinetobacter baumannii]